MPASAQLRCGPVLLGRLDSRGRLSPHEPGWRLDGRMRPSLRERWPPGPGTHLWGADGLRLRGRFRRARLDGPLRRGGHLVMRRPHRSTTLVIPTPERSEKGGICCPPPLPLPPPADSSGPTPPVRNDKILRIRTRPRSVTRHIPRPIPCAKLPTPLSSRRPHQSTHPCHATPTPIHHPCHSDTRAKRERRNLLSPHPPHPIPCPATPRKCLAFPRPQVYKGRVRTGVPRPMP
jgi:hypothetical protein